MRKISLCVAMMLFGAIVTAAQRASMSDSAMTAGQQSNMTDEGGRVLALENAWNRALEAKDVQALNTLLANTFLSVEIDGSVTSKTEFLASIKSADYQASQAVNEQSNVQIYGDAAVVVGVFRVKGTEKGKSYARRERFVDTWIKINGAWQCVATTSTLITAK